MNHVKKIFFEDNSHYPSFIMEKGGVKRPCMIGNSFAWFSNEEIAEAKRLKEIEDAKQKIITLNNGLGN